MLVKVIVPFCSVKSSKAMKRIIIIVSTLDYMIHAQV